MSKHHHHWGGPFNEFDNDPNTWGMYNQCVCGVKRYWPWTRWQLFMERLHRGRYHYTGGDIILLQEKKNE